MKKLMTALACFCLFALGAEAQMMYWPHLETAKVRKEHIKWQQKLHDSIKQEGIHAVFVYRKYYNKNGSLKRAALQREEHYDSNGRIVEYQYYTHKGKASNRYAYSYNADGIQSGFAWYKPDGKYFTGWQLHFDDKGQMVKVEGVCRNNKNCYNETYEYDAAGNAIKVNNYHDGKLSSHVEREYFSDGQLKETRNYNRKGKLRSVIKYDCTPAGVIAGSKAADTITKCSKTTMDADSNTIYTYETIRPDGKIWRAVNKINKKGQMVEYSLINPKGKLYYGFRRTYGANGRVAEVEYTGKSSAFEGAKERYTYNEQGRITQLQWYNKKGILEYETLYMFD